MLQILRARLAVLTLAGLMMFCEARAEVPEAAVRYANNFSHENLTCGVHHHLVSHCTSNRDPKDHLVETYRQTSLEFIQRAVTVGKIIGTSNKALEAKMEIAKQGMMADIENNCINISVLLQKHAMQCKRLFEDGPKAYSDAMDRLLR